MMSWTDQLISEIDAFLARTGMAPTALGRASIGDPHLVRNLRSGRTVTLKSADKVRRFMAAEGARLSGSMAA